MALVGRGLPHRCMLYRTSKADGITLKEPRHRFDVFIQHGLVGGVRLGAYGRDEIRTNQYFLFRTGYIHELGKLSPLFGEKIYGLGFYELGKTYGGVDPSRLPTDVNVGIIVNSLLGPLFVGGDVALVVELIGPKSV